MESNGGKRRLATILAADVVGYSNLMAQDEEATVRTLRSHREVIDRLIDRHEGRIFNTAGDAVLAEFGSAVEAVRCAMTIQDELRVRNAELADHRKMALRIGINLGDVLVVGDDLLGDGVNVAARLEGLAAPGGICISGSTFEQVKNKLSVGFEDLGENQVKNIPDPVRAYGITAGPVSVTGDAAPSPARRRRLAFAAALAVLVAAGGTAYWQFASDGPVSPASVPDGVSTDGMSARDIAALMSGMTIEGRLPNGHDFKIALNADRSASYEYSDSASPGAPPRFETGRWWVEDRLFCVQIRRFVGGRQACPRIARMGERLAAIRRVDGTVLPWRLSK